MGKTCVLFHLCVILMKYYTTNLLGYLKAIFSRPSDETFKARVLLSVVIKNPMALLVRVGVLLAKFLAKFPPLALFNHGLLIVKSSQVTFIYIAL